MERDPSIESEEQYDVIVPEVDAGVEAQAALDDFADSTLDAADPIAHNQRKRSKARNKQVSGGRVALLVSAFIPGFLALFLLALWALSSNQAFIVFAVGNLVVAAFYVALYTWARKNPVKGLQAGYRMMLMFALIEIGLLVNAPGLPVIIGLAIRLITLGLLLQAVRAAKNRQEIRDRAADAG